MAGPEIVDCNANTQRLQLPQCRGGALGIVHYGAFRDLQLEVAGLEAALAQHGRDALRKILARELTRRQIHRHADWRSALL